MIACALFAFVTTGIATVMREGIRFFNVNTAALEIQQQSIRAMDRLGLELNGASIGSFKSIRTSSQSGLIFGSNRNEDDELTQDPVTGDVEWHKRVCYYTGTAQNNPVLFRKEIMLGAPELAPPPIPDGMDLNTFSNDTGTGRKSVVARHVVALYASATNPAKLTLKTNYLNGQFTMTLNTFILLRN